MGPSTNPASNLETGLPPVHALQPGNQDIPEVLGEEFESRRHDGRAVPAEDAELTVDFVAPLPVEVELSKSKEITGGIIAETTDSTGLVEQIFETFATSSNETSTSSTNSTASSEIPVYENEVQNEVETGCNLTCKKSDGWKLELDCGGGECCCVITTLVATPPSTFINYTDVYSHLNNETSDTPSFFDSVKQFFVNIGDGIADFFNSILG